MSLGETTCRTISSREGADRGLGEVGKLPCVSFLHPMAHSSAGASWTHEQIGLDWQDLRQVRASQESREYSKSGRKLPRGCVDCRACSDGVGLFHSITVATVGLEGPRGEAGSGLAEELGSGEDCEDRIEEGTQALRGKGQRRFIKRSPAVPEEELWRWTVGQEVGARLFSLQAGDGKTTKRKVARWR